MVTYLVAGEVLRDDTLPFLVNFSLNEDSVCFFEQDDHDRVYYWQAPFGMTESYFLDFLIEVVNEIVLTEVSNQETGRLLELLLPTSELLPTLQRQNQKRIKLLKEMTRTPHPYYAKTSLALNK